MTEAKYYKNLHGKEPAKEWIEDSKNGNISAAIHGRIQQLQEDDLQSLIDRDIVVPIKCLKGLYELKRRGPPGWRLAFYHDSRVDKYFLLYGFRKTKDSQKSDIKAACKLALEYIERIRI